MHDSGRRISTSEIGRKAEDIAIAHLQHAGFRILERNLRTPEGEIDVIARDGNVIAFIEVKMRRSRRFGSAAAAVDLKKRRRIRECAADYMQFFPQGEKTMIRFDVVTIEHGIATLLRNAF